MVLAKLSPNPIAIVSQVGMTHWLLWPNSFPSNFCQDSLPTQLHVHALSYVLLFHMQILKKSVEDFGNSTEDLPSCKVMIIETGTVRDKLYEEVTVSGSKENLNFYITIAMPTVTPRTY